MVDFHYNIVVVKVKYDQKLPEAILISEVTKRGAVLAIGRFYDHGRVMCAQDKIRKQASTFDCSELLVSSCQTTMVSPTIALLSLHSLNEMPNSCWYFPLCYTILNYFL